MEENKVVAANNEGVATPQTEVKESPIVTPVLVPQQEVKPQEDFTQTKAFSRRLKEMTDRAVNDATSEMKVKLAELENQRQDQELLADSDVKGVYESIRTDVLKYSEDNKTDIKTAYKEVLAISMPNILKNLKERINEEAEKRIKENFGTSPGKLGTNVANVKRDYSSSTPQEMDEFIKQALRGELRSN